MIGNWPLSAHIGYLFADLPLRSRPQAARAAGFQAVEHPAPFEIPARQLARILDAEGLHLSQMSSGTGDAGRKGLACLPGQEAAFANGFRKAVDYAEAVGCPFVHPMAGVVPVGVSPDAARTTYLGNIEDAVRVCENRPATVLIEAISHAFAPGYLVNDFAIMTELLMPYRNDVRILLDTFHAAENSDSVGVFLASSPLRPGHIHIADHPGRHEPGTGSLDFQHLTTLLSKVGYSGAIGFEYIPSGLTTESLAWMTDWPARHTVSKAQAGGSGK